MSDGNRPSRLPDIARGSLRLRLLILSAFLVGGALIGAWFALTIIFERHVFQRLEAELENNLIWLTANLEAAGGDISVIEAPPDPRFSRPLGGLYWQINPAAGEPVRSVSLWDETLPEPEASGSDPTTYSAVSREGRPLILHAREVTLPTDVGTARALLIVAADRVQLTEPVDRFRRDIGVALAILGALLVVGVLLQIQLGLAPLKSVGADVAAIRSGNRARLQTEVPSEIEPLVNEVNALLVAQETTINRARNAAADLAHALKTPLTALSVLAEDLRNSGLRDQADRIQSLIDMLIPRIDRHLARARLGVTRSAHASAETAIRRLVHILEKTPRGGTLKWVVKVEDGLVVPADEGDLTEALGSVMENACKWAFSTVRITAHRSDRTIIEVQDDGKGLPQGQIAEVLKRGTTGDPQSGSGLGLSIANDIVTAYGGTLEVVPGEDQGLRVVLAWPDTPLRPA
jgi:signal transduction histidine kinase